MPWIYIALVSTVALSIAIILQRALMKEDHSDSISFSIVFQLGLGIVSLIFALIFGKLTLPSFDTQNLLRFALSSVMWAGATVFSFQAIKKLTAGEITILSTASSIIAITIGVFFLGEAFGIRNAIGALLIFGSILIVSARKLSFDSKEGIIFALLSSACAGIAVSNDAFILRSYNAFSYMLVISFVPAIILMIIFPKKIKQAKKLLNLKSIKVMSLLSLAFAIQGITYYLAFEKGAPVSQLSPFIKSSIVLTVILGVIFLNEKKDLGKKLFASIIVTIGAILLG